MYLNGVVNLKWRIWVVVYVGDCERPMLRIGLLKYRRIKIIEILLVIIKLGGRIVRVVVYYNLALPKNTSFMWWEHRKWGVLNKL